MLKTYVFDIDSDLLCLTVNEHDSIIIFEYFGNNDNSETYQIKMDEDRFEELMKLLRRYNSLTDLETLEVLSIVLGSEI